MPRADSSDIAEALAASLAQLARGTAAGAAAADDSADAPPPARAPEAPPLAGAAGPLQLAERRARLAERVAQLRADWQRRATAVRAGRRRLEERGAELRERRRRHEARAAEWLAAKRRLEAKRPRVSRGQLLRDPARHAAGLGAFHAYQELSVVCLALQQERRRRCSELAEVFPLKWILSASAGASSGDRAVSLGQVHSFAAPGLLEEDEIKDLTAALSFLLPMVAGLGCYLDVTLPFPCSTGRGAAGEPEERAWPSVLHPFTGRWRHFSILGRSCTKEFAVALRMVDEDLRRLCECQGDPAPAPLGTLQLLAHLLSSAHLGCLSPSAPPPPRRASAAGAGDRGGTEWVGPAAASQVRPWEQAKSSDSIHSRCDSWRSASAREGGGAAGAALTASGGGEDGEWTLVEEGASKV